MTDLNDSYTLPLAITAAQAHDLFAGKLDAANWDSSSLNKVNFLENFSGQVRFLDVRWQLSRSAEDSLAAFTAGHVPGATYVDLDGVLALPASADLGRHPLPDPTEFLASTKRLGISPVDLVVAYDDSNGISAGRLVWMLRALGFNAALLTGGFKAWTGEFETGNTSSIEATATPAVADSLAVTSTADIDSVTDSATAETALPAAWPAELTAELAEVADLSHLLSNTPPSDAPSLQLVDVRAAERYSGETEPVDPRAGHIPGAINLPASNLLHADGSPKSASEIAQLAEAAGIDPTQETILYCGSGVTASFAWTLLKHAGWERVRVYPGSFSQWCNQQDLPVATTE